MNKMHVLKAVLGVLDQLGLGFYEGQRAVGSCWRGRLDVEPQCSF